MEKSDSLTLKAMEIDIGEGESVEPEPEPADEDEVKVEPTPKPEEPVDYGSMSKREKRRARGQLRTDEIAKSKKVIDEKEAQREIEVMEQAVNGGETTNDEPAMEVDVSAPRCRNASGTQNCHKYDANRPQACSENPECGHFEKTGRQTKSNPEYGGSLFCDAQCSVATTGGDFPLLWLATHPTAWHFEKLCLGAEYFRSSDERF